MSNSSYQPKVYRTQGGKQFVVAPGGELRIEGAVRGIAPGELYFVDSSVTATGDGLAWASAFATLAEALLVAVAGDIIHVAPGHAETLTAAETFSVAGVTVVGHGTGNQRPAFTVNHTGDGFAIAAADVVIDNIRFVTPSAAASALINVAAARAVIRRCGFALGANVVDAVTITVAGAMPTFEECDVIVTANGPDSWLKFEGVVDRPLVRNNVVIGSDGTNPLDDGVFDFDSVAVTNAIIYGNVFDGGGQTVTVMANVGGLVAPTFGPNAYAGSATDADNVSGGAANLSAITDILSGTSGIAAWLAAAIPANNVSISEVVRQIYAALEGTAANQNGVATWPASAAPASNVSIAEVLGDLWDVLRNGTGGAEPASNKSIMDYLGVSPAFFVPSLGYAVTKSENLVTATGIDLFTVTGKVLITMWTGEVTVSPGGAGTTDYKLRVKADNVDLCLATDIHGAAVGWLWEMDNDAGDGLIGSTTIASVKAADLNGKDRACRVVGLAGGSCVLQSLRTAATTNGTMVHTLFYLPLEAGAGVVAA